MSITTRRGDEGMTDTLDGRRVSKASLDIELVGALDELNSSVGFARALIGSPPQAFPETLLARQKEVMELMGALSQPEALSAKAQDLLTALDGEVEALNGETDNLRGFVVPGENPAEGALQVARTVCRRAERVAVQKAEEDPRYRPLVRWLNRLSDVLFLYALQARRLS
jgi:cob(I)alamin adenosyltransferase